MLQVRAFDLALSADQNRLEKPQANVSYREVVRKKAFKFSSFHVLQLFWNTTLFQICDLATQKGLPTPIHGMIR